MKCFLRRWSSAQQRPQHALGEAVHAPLPAKTHPPLAPMNGVARMSAGFSAGARGAATLSRPAASPQAPMASPLTLTGSQMPGILFNNFDRRFLDLREIAARSLVLYVYPGCEHSPADGTQSLGADTMQHETYRVLRKRFAEAMPGGALIALSSISPTKQFHQSPELAWDQDEEASFQHYLVSDETLQLADELHLPTFEHGGEIYYERLTLVAREGRIQRIFHPVAAGQDARKALTWLLLH